MVGSENFRWNGGLWITLLCALASPLLLADEASKTVPGQVDQRVRRIESRQQHERRERVFPGEAIPLDARLRALDQIAQADAAAGTAGGGAGFRWSNIGPAPIDRITGDSYVSSGDLAGRITTIAVDPGNADHWLVGAAQGGVWETHNAGVDWAPRTDDQPSLAMGAITFAPSDATVVYAGTGEGNFSGDSYSGMGLLKSLDGGSTWYVVAGAPFLQTAISEIKVHQSDARRLALATMRGVQGLVDFSTNLPPTIPPRGVFISTNGGTNWTQTLVGEATDLEVDPGNFNRQYAALGEIFGHSTNGIYRSINAGTNWTRIQGPWMTSPGPTNIGRIEMAIAPSNPGRLYVSVAAKRVLGDANPLIGIWRTDDAWTTTPVWTKIDSDGVASQAIAWYSHDLLVHPGNQNVVYLAGFWPWRYNGSSWSQQNNQHADQHCLAWRQVGATYHIMVGNDGGLVSRPDPSGSWVRHNKGLSTVQFYKGAVHPKDSSLMLAGSQDNGTEIWTGDDKWASPLSGDGYSCAISTSKPDKYWALSHQESSGKTIYRSTDGQNTHSADFGIDANTVSFFIGFQKHPANENLFIAGAANLWRCNDFFSSAPSQPNWASNGPALLKPDGVVAEISALAFAPSDVSGQIYVFGTEDGRLRRTMNGGANWVDLDPNNNLPNRYISGLAFEPTNAQVLYVTLSGFDESTPSQTGHVFKTSNALAATPVWTNLSPAVNLPHACVAINPANPAEVVVGTDIGLWRSINRGTNWTHHGPSQGLPNVAVYDLQFDTNGALTAFTHGRGAFIYRLQFPKIDIPVAICWFCPPDPTWLNPGDLVTLPVLLHNILPVSTVNLTARLRATAQITPYNRVQVQSYGALSAGGAAVSKSFTFTANAIGGFVASSPCAGSVDVILDLEDAGASLGSITIPLQIGRPSRPLAQNFENAPLPELPANWFAQPVGVAMRWESTTNDPPNSLVGGDPDLPDDPPGSREGPPNYSAFAPDPTNAVDIMLYSPSFLLRTDRARLSFRQSIDMETDFDGGVLEISIGGGTFVDILAAGGSFSANGYNSTLRAGSALGGRRAWSGDSGGWLTTEVELPRLADRTVQLRWRLASDTSIGKDGWFIDDVYVIEFECVPPITNPFILRPGIYERLFGFFIQTVPKRTFYVEYKDSLDAAVWQPLQSVSGDGVEQLVLDPTRGPSQRFYRFRAE